MDIQADRLTGDRDALPWRSFAGDRDVRIEDGDLARQIDLAGDIEDDRPRPARRQGGAQTSRPRVIQIGDVQHGAARATAGDCPKTLGPSERGHGRR